MILITFKSNSNSPNGAISSRLKGTIFPFSYLNFPVTIPVSSFFRGTWQLNRGKIAITIFNFTPLNWYFQNTHEMTTWHSCSGHVTLSRVHHMIDFGSCDSYRSRDYYDYNVNYRKVTLICYKWSFCSKYNFGLVDPKWPLMNLTVTLWFIFLVKWPCQMAFVVENWLFWSKLTKWYLFRLFWVGNSRLWF